jgi:hypothetical protein
MYTEMQGIEIALSRYKKWFQIKKFQLNLRRLRGDFDHRAHKRIQTDHWRVHKHPVEQSESKVRLMDERRAQKFYI